MENGRVKGTRFAFVEWSYQMAAGVSYQTLRMGNKGK